MTDDAIPLGEARRRDVSVVRITELARGAPEFSDEELAINFAAEHEKHLRYIDERGGWAYYGGRKWEEFEQTRLARDLARQMCREFSARAQQDGKARLATELTSQRKSVAVEFLARSDRSLAARLDQFDRNPWLLNCPSFTIELEKGLPRAHRAEDYITRVTAVDPAMGGECPLWHAVLDRVTAGDRQYQAFLQRMAGYLLTGSTREHALFFLYGTGANGKSVFVNTLLGLLGDYAVPAPIETFTATQNEKHSTELAWLRGARLVAASETEQGRRWSESRIKTLTGGDKIAARFMKQDFFEYTPEFKLVIGGNHQPALRGVDEGIRRRMNLLPFTVTIPADERDDRLAEKLREEWPAILCWAIEGCQEWQGEGLAQPECVRLATEHYLAAEDALGQWIEEKCEIHDGFYATTADLFASWRKWAEKAGEFVGSMKRFSQALQDRGY
jgi:putative DNA primase/helicase